MARQILYVHGMASIGGAERDLFLLLRSLNLELWKATVACPETGAFRRGIEALNIPVSPIELPPWRKLSSCFTRYGASRRLRDLLSSLQPAIVHVNDLWWVPHTVRAVAALPRPIPVLAHVRQEVQPAKAHQYALDRVEHVVAVSQQLEKDLLAGGLSPGRVSTIYSGIDLASLEPSDGNEIRAQQGIPPEATVVGTLANLLPLKGYEVMLEALPAILAACPAVHYLIVGSGPAKYADRLKAITVDRGIADRVHFAGFQSSIAPYLEIMDLYVHPTLKEAFGLAVVEAMAMGRAVVATTAGGLPEVVVHEDTGLLVHPGDPRQLTEAVVSLLKDRMRRDHMGMRGKARSQQFSIEESVAKIERLYSRVLVEQAGHG